MWENEEEKRKRICSIEAKKTYTKKRNKENHPKPETKKRNEKERKQIYIWN